MRSGELARRAGVNIETLRYYERRGLLASPERLPNGYREYPESALERIGFIKRAQGLGFSLEEVEELLQLQPARGRQRARVRRLAQEKLQTIVLKLDELQSMRAALERLVHSCEHEAEELACPIIEALVGEEPALACGARASGSLKAP